MYYIKLFIMLFIIIPNFNVYSGTIDPNTSDCAYIEYGYKFDYVVKICGSNKDDSLYCASAVLIDDHHALTAAHVVEGSKLCKILIKDNTYLISSIIIHKNFNEQEFATADIALCFSEKSFNLDFYPSLYTKDDELNKVCSIAGYGLTGTFNTGANKSDEKRRAGSNMIDRTEKDVLICDPSPKSSPRFTQLEFFIASGDSGGGLFIENKLAGINSCIMIEGRSPKSKYMEESCHTRVSKFVDWINENKTLQKK